MRPCTWAENNPRRMTIIQRRCRYLPADAEYTASQILTSWLIAIIGNIADDRFGCAQDSVTHSLEKIVGTYFKHYIASLHFLAVMSYIDKIW